MTTQNLKVDLKHVLSGDEVASLQEIVRKVPVADHVIRYALQLTRLTRRAEGGCPDFVNDYVGWGAGPRASQYLILAGKARALLKGRYHVSTDDIRAVALPVLRHRIVTNFNAEAEGVHSDTVVQRLVAFVPRQGDEGLDRSAARIAAGRAGGVRSGHARLARIRSDALRGWSDLGGPRQSGRPVWGVRPAGRRGGHACRAFVHDRRLATSGGVDDAIASGLRRRR